MYTTNPVTFWPQLGRSTEREATILPSGTAVLYTDVYNERKHGSIISIARNDRYYLVTSDSDGITELIHVSDIIAAC